MREGRTKGNVASAAVPDVRFSVKSDLSKPVGRDWVTTRGKCGILTAGSTSYPSQTWSMDLNTLLGQNFE